MPVKTVYTTREIPHLWAHQKVPSARNRQGNLYFEGDTIFSYGSHFLIARMVHRKGKTAVLMTVSSYSTTTAGHIYSVRQACSHLQVFNVPVRGNHAQVKAYFKDECNRAIEYVRAAKQGAKAAYELGKVHARVMEYAQYAEFFGLKTRITLPEDWDDLVAKTQILGKRAEELRAAREAQKDERRRRREELERLKFEELLPKWENGEVPTNILPHTKLIYLRKTSKKPRIETSRGAQISLKFAEMLFGLCLECRREKKVMPGQLAVELKRGASVDWEYTLDSIAADGAVRAGCHFVRWEEIERLARRLKWITDESERTTAKTTA